MWAAIAGGDTTCIAGPSNLLWHFLYTNTHTYACVVCTYTTQSVRHCQTYETAAAVDLLINNLLSLSASLHVWFGTGKANEMYLLVWPVSVHVMCVHVVLISLSVVFLFSCSGTEQTDRRDCGHQEDAVLWQTGNGGMYGGQCVWRPGDNNHGGPCRPWVIYAD